MLATSGFWITIAFPSFTCYTNGLEKSFSLTLFDQLLAELDPVFFCKRVNSRGTQRA